MKFCRQIAAVILVATSSMMASSTPAQAALRFCSAPYAPTAFLRKPSKPYCAITQDCDELDVQMYQNEISRYFKALKKYAQDVDEYYENAAKYVKCMSELD
jgi:hypothetical protein